MKAQRLRLSEEDRSKNMKIENDLNSEGKVDIVTIYKDQQW